MPRDLPDAQPVGDPDRDWLIVGLGNPGPDYADTYHNAGFRVVSRLASKLDAEITRQCGPALVSRKLSIGGNRACLALPQTFMNRSGLALPKLFEQCGASTESLVVVYDDIALPLGRIRLRQRGSAGGHNGVESIISALGSDEFRRVRVGIRPERPIENLREFVLSRVAKADRGLLGRAEALAASAVELIVREGIAKAMAAYNSMDLRETEEQL